MYRHVALSLLCLLMLLSPLYADGTTVQGAQGMVVSVDSSGTYDIVLANPAWHFGGSLGHPMLNISTTAGTDSVGPFSEISFDFTAAITRHAAIRAYTNEAAVLFTLNYPTAAPCVAFPSFNQYPAGLKHIAFSGTFAPPTFDKLPEESPWAFFDSSANTFILSPASNFMAASLAQTPAGALQSQLMWQVSSVPAGFNHQTLLVVDSGINRAFQTWGNTLTALQGKIRPANDADMSLKSLGYWTDNGATYYYRTESGLSYMDTLTAAKAQFDRANIGLGYMQLDSWFYPKGAQAQWADSADGVYQYSADSNLFGSSLSNFQQSIGVPLVTHARWIDPSSPYRQQYTMSGNVVTDPSYWNMVATYLKAAGVATYEQDWLSAQAQTAVNLIDPELFLGGMAYAMAQAGLTMQYCMPTTRHVMQSARYGNLTTIRGANDRFNPDKWTPFLYTSRLIGAVGAWPFADVLMSGETSNLLLSTLSAGPIGLGDRIGSLNTGNVLRSVRQDGIIVKPDVPATPVDASFLNDAAAALVSPMVASTYTDFGGLRAYYLFAYPQGTQKQFNFKMSDLGSTGAAYVYDYFAGTGRVVLPSDVLSETISGDSLYLVAAPLGPSGMALIGDAGQFVTLGKKRITSLTDDGSLHIAISFAKGERSRTLIGYCPGTAPAVTPLDGTAGPVSYDGATGRFSVDVQPGAAGTSAIRLDRTTRKSPRPVHPAGTVTSPVER